jgi:hypothetical protein
MAISTTPQLYFLESALSTKDNALGLNVWYASSKPGTAIVLYPWQGGAANELWSVVDGFFYIVSALSNSSQTLYMAPSASAADSPVVTSTTPYTPGI